MLLTLSISRRKLFEPSTKDADHNSLGLHRSNGNEAKKEYETISLKGGVVMELQDKRSSGGVC